ncbi:MAG: hypothetical protein A2X86_14040 [Bdellovibrionales bacterium GWA2_49_15]|nr:MAG: hypothetical protein A2X86_14040 [Bdellovibrionales bacterium GWA2_49_15]
MRSALEHFSELLEYPHGGAGQVRATAEKLLRELEPVGLPAVGVRAFLDRIAGLSTEMLEELYSTTFELNPSVHLYAGLILLGESYKRGALLVELKEKLTENDVQIGTELPDFIPFLLRLLGRLEKRPEDASELQSYCLLPALQKIAQGLSNPENPYSPLLIATRDFLVPTETHV